MTSQDVTCPECGATKDLACRITSWGSARRPRAHQARVDLAASYRQLARLGEELGVGASPDLHDVEHLAHFDDDVDVRRTARKLLNLAEKLGYSEPGDETTA